MRSTQVRVNMLRGARIRAAKAVNSSAADSRSIWFAEVEQLRSRLTERELQVLAKMVEGKTDATIAEGLGIGVKTACNHRSCYGPEFVLKLGRSHRRTGKEHDWDLMTICRLCCILDSLS